MTREVQKAMVLQMYTEVPRKVYSSLASCTCQIYIYMDKMSEQLPLQTCTSHVRIYTIIADTHTKDEQSEQTTNEQSGQTTNATQSMQTQ